MACINAFKYLPVLRNLWRVYRGMTNRVRLGVLAPPMTSTWVYLALYRIYQWCL
jgi:hypothetical protein